MAKSIAAELNGFAGDEKKGPERFADWLVKNGLAVIEGNYIGMTKEGLLLLGLLADILEAGLGMVIQRAVHEGGLDNG